MTDATSAARWRAGILAAVLIAGGSGYWLGQSGQSDAPSEAAGSGGRKILYYYDPMFPNQKFDKPGKSPFMDMQLEPKYADEGSGAAPGVSVDPAARQSLGIRVVVAEMGSLAATFDVNGSIDFNQRDVTIVQARSGGFVERVYRLADVVLHDAVVAKRKAGDSMASLVDRNAPAHPGRQDCTAGDETLLDVLPGETAALAACDLARLADEALDVGAAHAEGAPGKRPKDSQDVRLDRFPLVAVLGAGHRALLRLASSDRSSCGTSRCSSAPARALVCAAAVAGAPPDGLRSSSGSASSAAVGFVAITRSTSGPR